MSFLGILMLDTRFERVLGDVGNIDSYPFEVRLRRVEGAGSLDVVKDGAVDPALLGRFISAARALEAEGAFAITSTCGFLVTAQDDIAAAVKIPVMVSALSLYSQLVERHGVVGVLTASSSSFGPTLRKSAGLNARTPVAGMEGCAAFADAILRPKSEQLTKLDTKAVEAYAMSQAVKLQRDTPELGAILLECGNLPPYAPAIEMATKLPVYSMLTRLDELLASSV